MSYEFKNYEKILEDGIKKLDRDLKSKTEELERAKRHIIDLKKEIMELEIELENKE